LCSMLRRNKALRKGFLSGHRDSSGDSPRRPTFVLRQFGPFIADNTISTA
jgi:hypothetical protein